jgi:hypothetical protein
MNMSSNVALMALPGRDCYTAAKGGVASTPRSMAQVAPYTVERNGCLVLRSSDSQGRTGVIPSS